MKNEWLRKKQQTFFRQIKLAKKKILKMIQLLLISFEIVKIFIEINETFSKQKKKNDKVEHVQLHHLNDH